MPLTASLVAICDALKTKLETNSTILGLKAVYYGDQDKLPVSPVVCVEPDTKVRDLKGVPRKTEVTVTVYLMVYHSEITDVQTNRYSADELAEAVETLVHQDPQLDGLVVHCMITRVESGYSNKANSIMRSSRLTFEATTQELLPMST